MYGLWQPPSYPVAEHSVTIEPGATTSLSSTYRPGTELRVEVRLPRAAAGERIELRFDRIAIASLPDGRTLHRRLRAADGGAGITGENGICDVACQEALLPGRYRLRMAPPFRRERLFRAPGDEHGRWMPLGGDDTPIELEIDLQPDSAPPVFDFSNR